MGLNDYAGTLSFYCLLIGGFVGYLLRPTVNGYGYYGKMPFWDMVLYFSAYGQTISYTETYLTSVAVLSIQYTVAGALVGMVVGWVLGKNTKKS
jgi:hypothetical protein